MATRAEVRRFFSGDWSEIDSGSDLLSQILALTGISEKLLRDRSLLSTSFIADRMKWAAQRQTTRNEDIAYCLMGLFNINMPVLYGEGSTKALRRLQEEIMHASFDQSIFVWEGPYKSSRLLAKSPNEFQILTYRSLLLWEAMDLEPFNMANIGLFLPRAVIKVSQQHESSFSHAFEAGVRMAILQCRVRVGRKVEFSVITLQFVPGASFNIMGGVVRPTEESNVIQRSQFQLTI